ncbi:MAG TPA: hypothetical protein VNK46_11440 [Nitrospiraceae bacterium]|nr:hypothetical protein [Nitrospiraceae bacterium]
MPRIGTIEMNGGGPEPLKLLYARFQFEESKESLKLLRLPRCLSINPARFLDIACLTHDAGSEEAQASPPPLAEVLEAPSRIAQ